MRQIRIRRDSRSEMLWLFLLLLLGCPLMMVFMMRGRHGDGAADTGWRWPTMNDDGSGL